jgi:beta-lactamase class A
MSAQSSLIDPKSLRWWYRLIVVVVAVPFLFSPAPCLAQPDDEEPSAPATFPDTKAGRELKWVLQVVNGRDLEDPAERFTPRFLELVPPDSLRTTLSSVRQKTFDGAKAVLHRLISDPDRADTISAVVRGEGTKRFLAVFLILDDKTGKIAGLRFAPAGGRDADPSDWKALEGDMGQLQGGVSFGAYELVPKDPKDLKGELRLRPIYEFGEEKRLAIGSTFKLYVLGALAEQVAKGQAKWDDKLAIKDEWKSLPSGVLHAVAAGTELPLSDYVEKMIAISDNTAATHLLFKVGRGQVEEYMAKTNEAPERTLPFLSPREMFIIKLGKDKSLADRYAAADQDTRRVMLAEGGDVAKGRVDLERASNWQEPIHIDDVEWFATAPECCRVMADLRRIEQLPGMEPLSKALRINAGIEYDKETWKSVAFKGGSEPGVMNLTYLLERKDGRWFALSVGWNNSKEALEEARAVELAGKGFGILAKEGMPEQAKPAKEEKKPARPRELNDGT